MRAHIPALLFTLLATAAPASAARIDLRLNGTDAEHMTADEERDAILASGDGARIVMRDRVGCQLDGAHCDALHGGPSPSHHCEDTYGHGTLTLRSGRRIHFLIAGRRCPHAAADLEHGVLVARSGLLRYVLHTRWANASDHRERVTLRVRSAPAAHAANELRCSACRFLVGVVRNFLGPHPTEAEITSAVEHACSYFPRDYQGVCSIVVEDHAIAIIAEIGAGHEAVVVCQNAAACPQRRRATARGRPSRRSCAAR